MTLAMSPLKNIFRLDTTNARLSSHISQCATYFKCHIVDVVSIKRSHLCRGMGLHCQLACDALLDL